MAYKSEMARARAQKRNTESAERRRLKFKMDGYNTLSNKSKSMPEDYSYNCPKTTNDILIELAETMSSKRDNRKRKNFVDSIVPDVISEAVQQYWRDRIGRGGIKF